MQKQQPLQTLAFWVTNISNRNVSLRDLNLTINAHASVNLLDARHYHYTLAQILASVNSGSIHTKSDKIVVRKVPPAAEVKAFINKSENSLPVNPRSSLEIKHEVHEELLMTDDEYAEQNADFADIDQQKQYFIKE